MALTSLYLDMKGKNVLIVGTGSVGIRRARRFLDAEANVSIITHGIDDDIKEEFISKGARFYDETLLDILIEKSDLVVVATSNHELNNEVSIKAKDKLLNCADNPSISNVIFPSTFDIGCVTLSIYTGSKSPLMAKELRNRIQSIITEKDILNIELQEYIRRLLKNHVKNQEDRKKYMIQFKEDEYIQSLLEDKKLKEAKNYVKNIIC